MTTAPTQPRYVHDMTCWLCGGVFWRRKLAWSKDHVIPRCEGGGGQTALLAGAHTICNHWRHKLYPETLSRLFLDIVRRDPTEAVALWASLHRDIRERMRLLRPAAHEALKVTWIV